MDFDLRVVGGDVTLVPGLRAPLRSYIKALVASWMVWPRCITVAIPGTGYELPGDAAERNPEIVGVLRVQVIGHQFVNAGGGDANRDAEGEVGLQVRWPVAELAGVAGLGAGASEGKGPASQSEERVAALANGAGDPGEIALPVENPRAQLLCVRWYGRHADADGGAEGFLEGGDDLGEPGANASSRKKSAFDRLEGEASVTLETLVRQATAATRRPGEASFSSPTTTTEDVVSWGPVAVAAELEPPPGADIASVRGASEETGGLLGLGRRAARGVGGLWGKSASGVVAGYRAARAEGLGSVRGAVAEGWRGESRRRREALDKGGSSAKEMKAAAAEDGADLAAMIGPGGAGGGGGVARRVVKLRVRYQALDEAATEPAVVEASVEAETTTMTPEKAEAEKAKAEATKAKAEAEKAKAKATKAKAETSKAGTETSKASPSPPRLGFAARLRRRRPRLDPPRRTPRRRRSSPRRDVATPPAGGGAPSLALAAPRPRPRHPRRPPRSNRSSAVGGGAPSDPRVAAVMDAAAKPSTRRAARSVARTRRRRGGRRRTHRTRRRGARFVRTDFEPTFEPNASGARRVRLGLGLDSDSDSTGARRGARDGGRARGEGGGVRPGEGGAGEERRGARADGGGGGGARRAESLRAARRRGKGKGRAREGKGGEKKKRDGRDRGRDRGRTPARGGGDAEPPEKPLNGRRAYMI